jgi:hypothetical protein
MDQKKIQAIKGDSIITLPINGHFYMRIQNVIKLLGKDKTQEDFKRAYDQIKEQKITEEWVEAFETLIIFCSAYEKMAESENKLIEVTPEELLN